MSNCNNLRTVLSSTGKASELFVSSDGSRLLLVPYGGRVLGLYSRLNEENFYWTHPDLASADTAQGFFRSNGWHNMGGDRTWLAPEIDIFFPDFPRTDVYRPPPQLDPGGYQLVRTANGVRFVNRLEITLSRSGSKIELEIAKTWVPASNPLRRESTQSQLNDIEYAGYTQETSLTLLAGNDTAPVGIWNLLQLPHGGEFLLPTYAQSEPKIYFGSIGPGDLRVTEHLVRYRPSTFGIQKIGIRAVAAAGRFAYLYPSGNGWALVARNCFVNPSGEYVDVPWDSAGLIGEPVYSLQACNVDNELGHFSELEYHAPAIGLSGKLAVDVTQVWAFRGSWESLRWLVRNLVSAEGEVAQGNEVSSLS
ncbi:MAG: DUF6786 family protein [Terriglobia bacterium]